MTTGMDERLYAKPRNVSNLNDSLIYHTMQIPGYGLVQGQWDLRNGIRQYTGELDFRGRRVLEVGTASGFVCFYMEQQGADVVAFELSEEQSWDIVPVPGGTSREAVANRRRGIRQMNNGFWFAHKAFGSRARVVYGTTYDIPLEIGPVDVSTFCSVLVHLRDPFLALFNASRLTRDTILVTDVLNPRRKDDPQTSSVPFLDFIPDYRTGGPYDAWWYLNPGIVQAFLGILGFADTRVTYHSQESADGERAMFSVVGKRTAGTVEARPAPPDANRSV